MSRDIVVMVESEEEAEEDFVVGLLPNKNILFGKLGSVDAAMIEFVDSELPGTSMVSQTRVPKFKRWMS